MPSTTTKKSRASKRNTKLEVQAPSVQAPQAELPTVDPNVVEPGSAPEVLEKRGPGRPRKYASDQERREAQKAKREAEHAILVKLGLRSDRVKAEKVHKLKLELKASEMIVFNREFGGLEGLIKSIRDMVAEENTELALT